MSSTPHVTALHVYPFKSAQGISVESTEVDEVGLRWDRRWMLVDGEGAFLTQRTHPRMAFLSAALEADALRVMAPELPDLELPLRALPEDTPRRPIRVWKQDRFMMDCGDEAAEWASAFLGMTCRVVRAGSPTEGPRVTEEGRVRASFADGAPALVISEATLADLNTRLAEPLPMNRFRPNIVITGVPAYAEDDWTHVRIGDVRVRGGWPCPRCVLTTVDQETAVKGEEPLRTLATYRRSEAGTVDLGMNVLFEAPGVLRVGDPIVTASATAKKPAPLTPPPCRG